MNNKQIATEQDFSNFVIFKIDNSKVNIDVKFKDETLWLTQKQLERIREIRASERRFYQKVTDIYALSADYDKNDELTKNFFTSVQNKMHWAICGKTAAEIIYSEAEPQKYISDFDKLLLDMDK